MNKDQTGDIIFSSAWTQEPQWQDLLEWLCLKNLIGVD